MTPEPSVNEQYHQRRLQLRAALRSEIHPRVPAQSREPPKLDHGWLLPTLLAFDDLFYGRWEYWLEGETTKRLPDRPIPPVDFLAAPDPDVRKMLTVCLDCIPNHGAGGWQGWSGWECVRYFLEWLLFGFGHPGQPDSPAEPPGCAGASMRLYQKCNVGAWLLWPHDYLGELLAENAYGRRQGFFPTPHGLVELMTQLTMGKAQEDMRLQSVCDPCVGTGRMLLHAGNHSLRLYGMEIDATLCQATLVNGYLYTPWLVRPFSWLKTHLDAPENSAAVAESIAAQAPPHLAEVLAETEHDREAQWQFEPIKKRRRRGEDTREERRVRQGVLF